MRQKSPSFLLANSNQSCSDLDLRPLSGLIILNLGCLTVLTLRRQRFGGVVSNAFHNAQAFRPALTEEYPVAGARYSGRWTNLKATVALSPVRMNGRSTSMIAHVWDTGPTWSIA